MDIPSIKIPESGAQVTGMPAEVKNRFDKIDTILMAVVLAVVMALISIVIAVTGIFLDQMRYNNAAYKEYSEKIQTLDSLKNSNSELLDQNKQNQELILKQQKQILDSFKK